MKLCWTTDIHLNFLSREKLLDFYELVAPFDALMITGDIAEAPSFKDYLLALERNVPIPIYFVLGNHDYYVGNVKDVRQTATKLNSNSNLCYLTNCKVINYLTNSTVLLGVDGWADTRAGDFRKSWVRLNDSVYIYDLRDASMSGHRTGLGRKMKSLADADTRKLLKELKIAATDGAVTEILIATHVPPFEEVCNYRGQRSGPDFLPFYCNKKLGDTIHAFAKLHPSINFKVYCGHTHGEGYHKFLDNLEAFCSEAEYREPRIAGVIDVKP